MGLAKFDPNDPKQLTDLLRKYFFESPWIARLHAEHKTEMLRVLKLALESNFDFAPLFDHEVNSERTDFYCLPGSCEVRDPRGFFEEIYRLAREYW